MNQKQINDLLSTMNDLLEELEEIKEKSKQVDDQCKDLDIRASNMKGNINQLARGLQSLEGQFNLVTTGHELPCLMSGNEL
ncbi:hypothetical protein [Virgibacillus dokdonensis]|uniref:Uncharacterized protein n=1 Tax=Virgibacillus dokdonensis TaxID=302167 RepID=A0A2K9IU87_9BACI|nr:hypothetical protein [Virgibacillus dokdonensis]AUJ23327.1 hypothetical protein A21D_00213 [Virgibacillus dokdonensis]